MIEDWSFLRFFRPKAKPPVEQKPMQKGRALVWGIRPIKPIVNVPPDARRVKIRLRSNSVGRAFVKYGDRVEEWILEPLGPGLSGDWKLGLLSGVNHAKGL